MPDDLILARFIAALRPVRGLVALVLGGSRGRGVAGPHSDYDFGLYYEPEAPLDVDGLRSAAAALADDPSFTLVGLGEWGPWINGGAWLTSGGTKVDLLYRDLGRVRDVIAQAREGRFSMNYQPGHPHGFASIIWMGEVATCRSLLDPRSVITSLKGETRPFPERLRTSLVARFGWEVGFAVDNARLAAKRGEQAHLAGCAYRVLSCVAQVLFALNGRYLINEKGAVSEAAAFPITLVGLAETQAAVWRDIGAADLDGALYRLQSVADDLGALL